MEILNLSAACSFEFGLLSCVILAETVMSSLHLLAVSWTVTVWRAPRGKYRWARLGTRQEAQWLQWSGSTLRPVMAGVSFHPFGHSVPAGLWAPVCSPKRVSQAHVLFSEPCRVSVARGQGQEKKHAISGRCFVLHGSMSILKNWS